MIACWYSDGSPGASRLGEGDLDVSIAWVWTVDAGKDRGDGGDSRGNARQAKRLPRSGPAAEAPAAARNAPAPGLLAQRKVRASVARSPGGRAFFHSATPPGPQSFGKRQRPGCRGPGPLQTAEAGSGEPLPNTGLGGFIWVVPELAKSQTRQPSPGWLARRRRRSARARSRARSPRIPPHGAAAAARHRLLQRRKGSRLAARRRWPPGSARRGGACR